MTDADKIFEQLAEPFPGQSIKWRAGATNSAKTQAIALAYVDARDVMDRLDRVVGPLNWKDKYTVCAGGTTICELSIRIDGEWLTKSDGSGQTNFEGEKGGLSGAFKRAAVKFSIGRYLYALENKWMSCEKKGKSVKLTATPPLPSWALPAGERGSGQKSGQKTGQKSGQKATPKPKAATKPKAAQKIAGALPDPKATKDFSRPKNKKDFLSYYRFSDLYMNREDARTFVGKDDDAVAAYGRLVKHIKQANESDRQNGARIQ